MTTPKVVTLYLDCNCHPVKYIIWGGGYHWGEHDFCVGHEINCISPGCGMRKITRIETYTLDVIKATE